MLVGNKHSSLFVLSVVDKHPHKPFFVNIDSIAVDISPIYADFGVNFTKKSF